MISKSMTIAVPVDVVVRELKSLFETPRSLQLMREILPAFAGMHKIVEMDPPTHVVYQDGGLMTTVDLRSVGDLTEVTIRIPHGSVDKGAAEISMLAQLCAFESLEQGYIAGLKDGRKG